MNTKSLALELARNNGELINNNSYEINQQIKTEFKNILNSPLSNREKEREAEIKQIILEEKIKWEFDKRIFEANPFHWSNNKRRRMGMPPLRGAINKNRSIKFHAFKPTPRVFFLIEDIIEEILPKRIDSAFEQFVDIKEYTLGDIPPWN